MARIMIEAGSATKKGQVAIWERDDAHPDGEIYLVGGDAPIEVEETALVRERMAKDLIVRVEGGQRQPARTESSDEAPPSVQTPERRGRS